MLTGANAGSVTDPSRTLQVGDHASTLAPVDLNLLPAHRSYQRVHEKRWLHLDRWLIDS